METFIYETKLSDLSLCDELIRYHENNLEYKQSGVVGKGVDTTTNTYRFRQLPLVF